MITNVNCFEIIIFHNFLIMVEFFILIYNFINRNKTISSQFKTMIQICTHSCILDKSKLPLSIWLLEANFWAS